MAFPSPSVDIRAAPVDFDELVDWLERWSYRLVLLEEYELHDIRTAVESVERAVHAHRARFDPWVRAIGPKDEPTSRAVRVVLSDHEWFEISLEQLVWFLQVVEQEDHGGHRQALGQFGRVLAEALRRHRRDEAWLEGTTARGGTARSPSPGNPN